MPKNLQLSLSALFLLLNLSTVFNNALAQSNTGSIHGKATNDQNAPLEFANVVLAGTKYQTTTNEKGEFEFKDIPAGKYTLQIAMVGHKNITKAIDVAAGQDLEINDLSTLSSVEMEEVSVYGKSESEELRQQGFQVNVIDLKTQYNTTSDLNQVLNNTSGIRIREEGGLGSNFNFSLNGFSGNQVKFFLDGIPMDKFGASLTLNNFPTNIAERIEVYKGVIPVSLGTDALGGAINLVTRNDLNYLDLSYSYGSFNTHRPAISGAYTSKKGLTVRLNTFYNYSDNNYKVLVPIKDLNSPAASVNYPGGDQWVNRFHDQYQSGTVQFEVGVTGKKYADKLLFGIIASGNDKDVQTGVVMEDVYGAIRTKSRSFIPTLKYKKDNLFIKGLDLSLYSAYNTNTFQRIDTTGRIYNWRGEWIKDPAISNNSVGGENSRTTNENKEREFLSGANLSYRIGKSNTIAVNYLMTRFRRTSYDAENPNNYTNFFPSELNKNVIGIGWNSQIGKRFTSSLFGKFYQMKSLGYQQISSFTGPVTYEAISYSYSNPGYGLALAYFIYSDLQVKASYEKAYRLPESSEIFGDGLWTIYSPGLRPEKSDNFNFGIRYNKLVSDKHKFGAEIGAIYRNTIDFIRVDQSTAGANRSTINTGKVLTKGIEGELSYSYKKRFYTSVNATYQSIIDNDEFKPNMGFGGGVTRNFTYGYRLPNLPYLFANANAGINLPVKKNSLAVNYTLNYVHEYYLVPSDFGSSESNAQYIIPEQFAHNISATYSLAKGKYNITLECRNFTDNLLYDSFRLQKPGISFFIKLRYFISK